MYIQKQNVGEGKKKNIALLTVRTHLTKLLSTTTYRSELKSNVHLDKTAFS